MLKEASFRDFLGFVLSRLKPHHRIVVWCLFLSVAAAGLSMLGPVLMGRGFDLAGQHRPFLWYGGALAGWWLLTSLAESLRIYVATSGGVIAEKVAADEATDAILVLLDKPLSYHYGSKMSEVVEKVGSFRWHLENFIAGPVFEMVPALLTIIAVLAYLFFLDWRVAAILTLALMAFLGYSYRAGHQRMKLQSELGKLIEEALGIGWDAVKNVLVVKSTTNEAAVSERLREQYGRYCQALISHNRHAWRMDSVLSVIAGVGMAGALMSSAARFSAGQLTFGQLSAVTAYAFTIFGYVRWAHWAFAQTSRVLAKYREVLPELQAPAEDFVSGQSVELKGGVEFRNVRFRYRDDKSVLEDVSFSARVGERVALIGESGEGKTTLVDLLGRYYEPQAGEIWLDDRPLKGLNLRSLRSQMAYVPQDLTLFNETLGFNIHYGRPEASDAEVREAARLAHLDEFIESLPEKYETKVGERGLKLSGGERQRVALARAFLRDPVILVLDEPTSNLDSKTEEHIRASLETLMKGRTTFIIAHRLHTIQKADRILVLKNGRIVEQGTHAELIRRPGGAYVELLQAQGGYISPNEPHLGERAEVT